MIDSTLAKKLGKKACIAACLATTALVGCTNDAAVETHDTESTGTSALRRTGGVNPGSQVQAIPVDLPTTNGACGGTTVWFDGECRGIDFFDRLRSAGSDLIAIAGPRERTPSADTGVILTETVGLYGIQHLFILPTRARNGMHQMGYLYRDEYPLVQTQTSTFWKDSNGMQNRFTEDRGMVGGWPTRFGTRSWKHWVQTPGGYDELWSDGTWASGRMETGVGIGGNQAAQCAQEGANAKASFTAACEGVVLVLAAGSVVGGLALSGVVIAATISTGGLAALPLATAVTITGVGGAVGGVGAAAIYNTMNKVCDAYADAAATRAENACLSRDPLPEATDFTMTAEDGAGTVNVGEPCPPGTVSWNGPARYCARGGSEGATSSEDPGTSDDAIMSHLAFSSLDDDEVSEEIVVIGNQSPMAGPTCAEVMLDGQCAIVQ